MSKLRLAMMAGGMLAAFSVAANSPAEAQGASGLAGQSAKAAPSFEATAQSRRRRAPTRLYITRDRAYLPPNAVRACDAWYEQEFRPSGTVIVPRMRCRWVNG
jgi:hypothetical protein